MEKYKAWGKSTLNLEPANWLGLLVFFTGCLVLVGWQFEIAQFKSVVSGWIAMKPNTALCMMAMGLSVFFLQPVSKEQPGWRRTSLVFAGLALLIASTNIFEYLTHTDLGLDEILFKDTDHFAGRGFPGRMTLTSAIVITLLATALAMRSLSPSFRRLSDTFSIIAMAATFPSLIGYLYGVESLYSLSGYNTMAAHTGILSMLVSICILWRDGASGSLSILLGNKPGAQYLRFVLPWTILLPIGLGWIRLKSEVVGFYDVSLGLALIVMINVFVLTFVAWRAGRRVEEFSDAYLESEARFTKLEVELRKWAEVFTQAKWGIAVISPDRTVVQVNPAFSEMHGSISDDWRGRPVMDMYAKESLADIPPLAEKIKQTGHLIFDSIHVRKDGSKFPVLTDVSTVYNENGEVAYRIASFVDTTERKQAELERSNLMAKEQAALQASKLKSEFLATMSHEIRTPINGVMGMTGLLLDTPLNRQQREYVEIVRQSADGLLHIVNDILDFSKIEAGKVEFETIDFSFEEMIANIESSLIFAANKKGIKLIKHLSPDVCGLTFSGDPNRISQVLINLINNAVKFTPAGRITIDVRISHSDRNLRTVLVEVTDTGIGIPQEALERMFTAFSQADASTTRKFGGTGLGLSICKHLVTLMKGDIGVRSQVGGGSTFWFSITLPTLESKIQAPASFEAKALSLRPDGKPVRILLAEDNTVNQLIAIGILEKFGYRVDVVSNGEDAVHALGNINYDLILMDCQMPVMDGYEASRKIRQMEDLEKKDVPIIAMTANAMSGDRLRCLDAGMTDYVSKPFKAPDLINTINVTLQEKFKKIRSDAA